MTQSAVFLSYAHQEHLSVPPERVVQGDRWRISILGEALIRLEWSDDNIFEDAATQMAVCRDFGKEVQFDMSEQDGRMVIDTPSLHLVYDRQPFSKEGLSIVVKGVPGSQFNTWHYGDAQSGNLGGTARTLDFADGPVRLDAGVASRDGWAVIDDSASNIVVDADTVNGIPNPYKAWVMPRSHRETDIYFFGYGHRYIEAVRDFCRLAGPMPLLPRYALGNWWSRFYRYTQDSYLELMDRFEEEGVPFTAAVIDMDWHLVDIDPVYGSGWTGYTWNTGLFPDHRGFLRELHRRGLAVTLNLHPRDGIRAFEKEYARVAQEAGQDPRKGKAVEFDLTDPRFVRAYLDMHHRMEDDGVDFWWIDWQQGGVTRQRGLDPLWMLNHIHYYDSGRDGKRPLIFSRYAGPGSHRYSIGFSGDTIVSWKSLEFQPYFTSTASNIGYGWWSHDIGGHMLGSCDDELEARWYQFGVFSPVNRLHSSNSPFSGKEPWNFRAEVRESMDSSLRLRHALIPYLYTMCCRAADTARPLIEPMYWQSPENLEAYSVSHEYRFGTELIAAPIVSPNDPQAQRGHTDIWFPQGQWFDFFDGRQYSAAPETGRCMEVWRGIGRIPVFARSGGIIPMQDMAAGSVHHGAVNPRSMEVLVFPGSDGSFTMREDSGRAGSVPADTALRLVWRSSEGGDVGRNGGRNGGTADGNNSDGIGSRGDEDTVFTIGPVAGSTQGIPQQRDWKVIFRGVSDVPGRAAGCRPAGSDAAGRRPVDSDTAVSAMAGGSAGGRADADMATADNKDAGNGGGICVFAGGRQADAEISYDKQTLSLEIRIPNVSITDQIRVVVRGGLHIADDPVDRDVFELLLRAQIPYIAKDKAFDAVRTHGIGAVGTLSSLSYDHSGRNGVWQDIPVSDTAMPAAVIQAVEEILSRGV